MTIYTFDLCCSYRSNRSKPAEDCVGELLRTGLSAQISSNVLALGNGAQGSLLDSVSDVEQVHVSGLSAAALSMSRIAHRSIIREDKRRAVGLARPLPSMSGAEPWTASKMEASLPMLPDGVKPRPPMRPADKSERMSPYLTLVWTQLSTLRDSQVRHDHDSLGERCWVGGDPQANSVEEVLGVLDVRVLLGDFSTGVEEHTVGHLPENQMCVSRSRAWPHSHDRGLVDGGDLSSAVLLGVVEGVSCYSLGSLVGNKLDGLHNTIDDLDISVNSKWRWSEGNSPRAQYQSTLPRCFLGSGPGQVSHCFSSFCCLIKVRRRALRESRGFREKPSPSSACR